MKKWCTTISLLLSRFALKKFRELNYDKTHLLLMDNYEDIVIQKLLLNVSEALYSLFVVLCHFCSLLIAGFVTISVHDEESW